MALKNQLLVEFKDPPLHSIILVSYNDSHGSDELQQTHHITLYSQAILMNFIIADYLQQDPREHHAYHELNKLL